MDWTRDRVEAVWRDLEDPRERPVKILRARFRKQVDLRAIPAEIAEEIAAVFVFWGVLQVAEAWLRPDPDRRRWLGEARAILHDAIRASSSMELRRLAILDGGIVDFLLGLSPRPGASVVANEPVPGVLAVGAPVAPVGPVAHDLARDHFTDAMARACASLADAGRDGIAVRTVAAGLLGLGSTTSRVRDRIAWLRIAERSPDGSIAERCREERDRLERGSAWTRRFGRDHTSAVAPLLPIELSLDVLVLPDRARDIVAGWNPATLALEPSPDR